MKGGNRPRAAHTLYDASKGTFIDTPEALDQLLEQSSAQFYVYVLCYPPKMRFMRPIYVGIGQGRRLFAHEDEACRTAYSSAKLEAIRQILEEGNKVVRVVDSLSHVEPWAREEELINRFGLEKDGSGVLKNDQRYAPSCVREGLELRKYADHGNSLPSNFIHRETRLAPGPRKPSSESSVYGKIYSVLAANPGATGAELVELLLSVNFSSNKSAYTSTGTVSRPWLAKYIDGGFYAKNQHICRYDDESA